MAESLALRFDPNTIEHLGFKMYSRLPNAVAELVANAFDADAEHVNVTLDTSGSQRVTVVDDGHGMGPTDLAERYLRIGRNRRRDADGLSESGKRKVAGRKGLGKLALFGIGKRITIHTKRAGSTSWSVVTMDWDAILGETDGVYRPEYSTLTAKDPGDHGTTISVEDLQRKSPVNARSLAESLAKLFNYGDTSFEITVAGPRTEPIRVSRELRYAGIDIEAEWQVPEDLTPDDSAPPIAGVIITAAKPLPQEMRGITLYAKGRLANDPEYFGVPESSYAFSYITGHINADYLDDLDDDVIATDRRSVSWEGEDAGRLREYLADILREIATRRRETRARTKRAQLKKDLGVDVEDWISTIHDERRSQSVKDVLDVLESPDTELSDGDRDALVVGMSEIAPEYADLHWRTLHPRIQEAAESLYRSQHYHHAVVESVKRYITDLRSISGINGKEIDVINGSFGGNFPKVDIAADLIEQQLTAETLKNMRKAQHVLSEGLWSGFRDPLMHEEVAALLGRDIFTYQDCLDALSLVSYLRRRIDRTTNISEHDALPE